MIGGPIGYARGLVWAFFVDGKDEAVHWRVEREADVAKLDHELRIFGKFELPQAMLVTVGAPELLVQGVTDAIRLRQRCARSTHRLAGGGCRFSSTIRPGERGAEFRDARRTRLVSQEIVLVYGDDALDLRRSF